MAHANQKMKPFAVHSVKLVADEVILLLHENSVLSLLTAMTLRL
jgi:hypothetical protein